MEAMLEKLKSSAFVTDLVNRPKPRRALRFWHRRWWTRLLVGADKKLLGWLAALVVITLLTLGQIFLPII